MREIHPCEGKNCIDCETCIYDKPIESGLPEKKLMPDEVCNYCGYLIKQYKDHNDTIFNACCSKCRIETANYARPRTIDFRLNETNDIKRPEWCPKKAQDLIRDSVSHTPPIVTRADEYNSYTAKRNKLKELPNHLDWGDICIGKIYIVPPILGRKRKIIKPTFKSEYCLTSKDVGEDGKVLNSITNIYKTDIDVNFIVELKNF